jgi:hypothetical protein
LLNVNRRHPEEHSWKRAQFPPGLTKDLQPDLACPSCVLDMSGDYMTRRSKTPDEILIKYGKNSGKIRCEGSD